MCEQKKNLNSSQQLMLFSPAHLIAWFLANRRSMPWRNQRNPYRVWVSEIMLQQTQVATVIPYFDRFMESFPDPLTLAEADLELVLKHWEGLGYYSRARNLHKGAQYIVNHCGGCLPSSYEELIKVPGIGDYTAGAILSFAFDQPVPAVDGNVVRVLARFTALEWVQGQARDRKKARELVSDLMADLPSSGGLTPALLNESLIELGALICRPRSPLCTDCPLRADCRGLASGQPDRLPLPQKRTVRPVEHFTVLVVKLNQGKKQSGFLLYRRKDEGLLGGLWDFPTVEGHRSREEVCRLLEERGYAVHNLAPLVGRHHIFSHLEWDMQGFFAELETADDCTAENTAENTLTYDGRDVPADESGLFTGTELRDLPQSTAMDHFRRQLEPLL